MIPEAVANILTTAHILWGCGDRTRQGAAPSTVTTSQLRNLLVRRLGDAG
jgi:hypothetical protein